MPVPVSEAFERWRSSADEPSPDFDALPSAIEAPEPDWDAFRHWWLGSIPTAARFDVDGTTLRFAGGATLGVRLLVPDGDGPFPVFVTQAFHHSWAAQAVRRGFLVAMVSADDDRDDTDTFDLSWPNHDWSRLARRGWALCRALDVALAHPSANTSIAAVCGHSRNGKAALIASALDDRFSAVISSSSGAGGVVTARDTGEQGFAESIERLTYVFPDWFHPRLRQFAGREDRLPADVNSLVARSAPRRLLISSALNDYCEPAWQVQRTYDAVRGLWPNERDIRIAWRAGGHETNAAVVEGYLDWALGGDVEPTQVVPRHAGSGAIEPGRTRNRSGGYGAEPAHVSLLLGRTGATERITFGENVRADIFGEDGPNILWLHGWSFNTGYACAYTRERTRVHERLVADGFRVFCFDQIGFGMRQLEAVDFASRHPDWSLLGKMVRDASDAVDAIGSDVAVVGFGLGAIVALHLEDDPRIKAIAAVCPGNACPSYPLGATRPLDRPRPAPVLAVLPTDDRFSSGLCFEHAQVHKPDDIHGFHPEIILDVAEWLRAQL